MMIMCIDIVYGDISVVDCIRRRKHFFSSSSHVDNRVQEKINKLKFYCIPLVIDTLYVETCRVV